MLSKAHRTVNLFLVTLVAYRICNTSIRLCVVLKKQQTLTLINISSRLLTKPNR